jgi:hypothetical protein
MATWHSPAYDHYNISLHCHYQDNGSPDYMSYVFTCKTHPNNHAGPITHDRMKTGHGTSNLGHQAAACLEKQGVVTTAQGSKLSLPPYSPVYHQVLLALRAAKYARPVNMYTDEEYLKEVELLCPGTTVPSPDTVGEDIQDLYQGTSVHIMQSLMVWIIIFAICIY